MIRNGNNQTAPSGWIQNGLVLVNGEIDTRRGRKLYPGDIASFDGNEIKIEK